MRSSGVQQAVSPMASSQDVSQSAPRPVGGIRPLDHALTVEVGRGLAAVEAMHGEWLALVAEHPAPPFSMQPAWTVAYLRHLHDAGPDAVLCLVLRRGRRCRGILCLSPTTYARFGVTATVLTGPRGSEQMLNACVLGHDEALGTWWGVIGEALRRENVAWQVLCCPRLCDDAQLHRLSRGLGVRKVFRVQDATRHLDCTGGYEALSARYSTRLRKILKKGWTGLQRQGAVALRVVSEPAERDAAFDTFLRLEGSGWKGPQGERSSLSDAPTLRAFYRDLFTGPSAPPDARITLLTIDGVPVAAQLCMDSGGTRSLLKIAYDQAQARYSPGSVLLDAVVRDCCASDDLTRLSFVTSDRWMDEWGASSVPVGDLWLFRSGITGATASLVLHVLDTP